MSEIFLERPPTSSDKFPQATCRRILPTSLPATFFLQVDWKYYSIVGGSQHTPNWNWWVAREGCRKPFFHHFGSLTTPNALARILDFVPPNHVNQTDSALRDPDQRVNRHTFRWAIPLSDACLHPKIETWPWDPSDNLRQLSCRRNGFRQAVTLLRQYLSGKLSGCQPFNFQMFSVSQSGLRTQQILTACCHNFGVWLIAPAQRAWLTYSFQNIFCHFFTPCSLWISALAKVSEVLIVFSPISRIRNAH